MSAQLVVVIAGAILVAAIIGSLIFLHGYSGKFTFDTKTGTRPRAKEGEGTTPGVSSKSRFKLLTAGVGAVFAAIVAKLWSMQMVSSDYYEELAVQNQTRTITTPAPRGRILDRNGEALVTNRPSLAVVAYRDLASNTVCVRHLANVLGMPYMAVLRNIQDNTEGAQSLHTIATDVRRSTVAYIQEHPDIFPGVEIAERTARSYPYGTLACHVLGYTGSITREQLEAQSQRSEEEREGSIQYQSGDTVGQAGVEYQYENLLQGIRGEQKVNVDAAGNVTGQADAVPPRPGSDIKLTLDLGVQKACEEALRNGIKLAIDTGHVDADAGAIVCMDCSNGEILGMASIPAYDPSVFIGGISNDLWNEFNSDEGGQPLLNRAVSGQYMSASTIKPLSSLAGLEYGVYTAERTTNCTGWWTGLGEAYGKSCWLHSGHGPLTLDQAITHSCDPTFYEIGKGFFYDKDNPEGLQEMYRRWGLGQKTGIDLPSEFEGRVPDSKWKESYFTNWSQDERAWNPGDMTNIAIGQGDILVTPIQMACVYAGLGMRGTEPVPHVFLNAVSRDGTGEGISYKPKTRLKAKIHSDADFEVVDRGMEGVIYGSNSSASHFSTLPVSVRGKSGSGEKNDSDAYGWYVAYAPADKAKYVVACLLERNGGSGTALPPVRDVLGYLYNSQDTSTSGMNDQTR